ncbi:MAG: hypothetical protein HYR48_04430 [Gemmatimonadetes bacterium]|nr:hypothetical protein [Gemmatimonadota bacterium]
MIERGLAERYAAGTLAADEARAFEDHYVGCEVCQREVRLAAAVRQAVAEAAPTAPARRRWALIGGAGALAAAAVLVLVLRPGSPASRFAPLGAVLEPPIYLGVQVRGPGERADSLFEAAMDAYADRRYPEAAAGLEAAIARGVDAAPAEFFRGSSLLMLDRSAEAAESYRRVIALGETPYLTESHYYLAKALLRLGRGGQARDELRRAAARGGEVAAQAAALADSVEAWSRR